MKMRMPVEEWPVMTLVVVSTRVPTASTAAKGPAALTPGSVGVLTWVAKKGRPAGGWWHVAAMATPVALPAGAPSVAVVAKGLATPTVGPAGASAAMTEPMMRSREAAAVAWRMAMAAAKAARATPVAAEATVTTSTTEVVTILKN
jgi:hypothetical protein